MTARANVNLKDRFKAIDPQDQTNDLLDSVFTYRDFILFDDFLQQTLTEADEPWILNSGSDAQAIDPAINAQAGGVVRVTTGDVGSGVAADGSQLVSHIPVTASGSGIVFETRLHINTATTAIRLIAGLTDSTSLEQIAAISAGDAITTTLSDGCVFVYDTIAATDEWFAVGVDSNTDATGNGTTGVAPTADTYQILRIEIESTGSIARFYIDDVLVKTLTANATTPTVSLYPTVLAIATTTTSKTVDVDYVYVRASR